MDDKDFTVFRQARDVAKKRLFEVEEECNKLENEKLSLQATVAALDELLEDGEPIYSGAFATAFEAIKTLKAETTIGLSLDPLYGLTEACRQLLANLPNTGMQISEIVKMLEDGNFDFSNYTKPVSAVHTILTRFCKSGEAIITGRTPGGRPLYAPRVQVRREQASPQYSRGRVTANTILQSATAKEISATPRVPTIPPPGSDISRAPPPPGWDKKK